ncbi:hypothetical protein LguiA_029962 [Lonicera macranthoides]
MTVKENLSVGEEPLSFNGTPCVTFRMSWGVMSWHVMRDTLSVASLQPDLGNYWPSLITSWTNKLFWDHEWTAHGNCSCDVLPPLQDFSAAITQSKKTDIRQWLRVAKAKPIQPLDNGLFRQSAIENAIKAVIGNNLNIYVSCRRYSDDRYYLYEIYICLDKTATNYVTCLVSNSLRGCPKNKDDPLIKATLSVC